MRVRDRERLKLDARVDAGAVLTQEFLLGFATRAGFSLLYVSALSALSVVLRRLDQPYRSFSPAILRVSALSLGLVDQPQMSASAHLAVAKSFRQLAILCRRHLN